MMVTAQRKVTGPHREVALVYCVSPHPRRCGTTFARPASVRVRGEGAKLGWEAERILVLDGDLGISGSRLTGAEGYKELVGRVCLGEVGAIFGLEVARLARSNAELQRLVGVVRADGHADRRSDGIYDLQDFNDRLLLGLKGTMSEAELHIITFALAGRQARRGRAWRVAVPAPGRLRPRGRGPDR